jgi:transcriptional/translational regulatory protein YebC/TACO1
MSSITISLHDILLQHFGASVAVPATIDLDELLESALDGDEHEIDLNDHLARQREIAVIWSIEDVQSVRPDLSEDQAWEVLKFAHRGHDANYGINWESLEAAAEALFGFAGDAPAAEGGHHA